VPPGPGPAGAPGAVGSTTAVRRWPPGHRPLRVLGPYGVRRRRARLCV